MTSVHVRTATPTDAPTLAAIQLRSWRGAYSHLVGDLLDPSQDAEQTAAITATWRRAITAPPSPRHAVHVAVGDDLVVGFLAHDEAGDIVALAVDPAHQRQGHGSRLLAAAARGALDAGITSLGSWSPEADEARRALLVSAGFRPDGARRELVTGEIRLVEEHFVALLGSDASTDPERFL